MDTPTTEFYAWRTPWVEDGRVTHYVIPRSDPQKYETPASGLYDTTLEARYWYEDEVNFYIEEGDEAEVEYMKTWLLVKITTEVV